jgi:hypothetical protein
LLPVGWYKEGKNRGKIYKMYLIMIKKENEAGSIFSYRTRPRLPKNAKRMRMFFLASETKKTTGLGFPTQVVKGQEPDKKGLANSLLKGIIRKMCQIVTYLFSIVCNLKRAG